MGLDSSLNPKSQEERSVKCSNIDLQTLNYGEFDPGSGRTLAAGFIHASRTRTRPSGRKYSGARVSNAWATYPRVGNNLRKRWLIPHIVLRRMMQDKSLRTLKDGPASD